VIAFGIDKAGVLAAVAAMEGLFTGNPEITLAAMITGLAGLGINVGVEMLDYFMQVSVADPKTMNGEKWEKMLAEMRQRHQAPQTGTPSPGPVGTPE
jgi:hypothetical protein